MLSALRWRNSGNGRSYTHSLRGGVWVESGLDWRRPRLYCENDCDLSEYSKQVPESAEPAMCHFTNGKSWNETSAFVVGRLRDFRLSLRRSLCCFFWTDNIGD